MSDKNVENPITDKEVKAEETPRWMKLPTVDFRSLQHKTIGQILVENEAISEKQLEEALKDQSTYDEDQRKLGEVLVEKEFVTREDMLKALAIQLDLPYYDRLPINDIDPGLVDSIPIQFCRDNMLLPIARDDFNVTVAVSRST